MICSIDDVNHILWLHFVCTQFRWLLRAIPIRHVQPASSSGGNACPTACLPPTSHPRSPRSLPTSTRSSVRAMWASSSTTSSPTRGRMPSTLLPMRLRPVWRTPCTAVWGQSRCSSDRSSGSRRSWMQPMPTWCATRAMRWQIIARSRGLILATIILDHREGRLNSTRTIPGTITLPIIIPGPVALVEIMIRGEEVLSKIIVCAVRSQDWDMCVVLGFLEYKYLWVDMVKLPCIHMWCVYNGKWYSWCVCIDLFATVLLLLYIVMDDWLLYSCGYWIGIGQFCAVWVSFHVWVNMHIPCG